MSQLVVLAERYCEEYHHGQIREITGKPYSDHPKSVAAFLARHGYADEVSQCIALMHDLKEDNPKILITKLKARFGYEIASGVFALSRNTITPKSIERHAIRHPELRGLEHKAAARELYKDRFSYARDKVIVAKIGDMWDNTNDLELMDETPRERKISEAIEFYIPLGRTIDPILTASLETNVREYLIKTDRAVPSVLAGRAVAPLRAYA